MAQTQHVEADPKEIALAQARWKAFTKLMTYGSISVALVLVLMLLFIY